MKVKEKRKNPNDRDKGKTTNETIQLVLDKLIEFHFKSLISSKTNSILTLSFGEHFTEDDF